MPKTASTRAAINAELASIKTRRELREYMGTWRTQRRGEGWDEEKINSGRAWLVIRWRRIHRP